MPYAPALLLLLFTAWAGTFEGAASAVGSTVEAAALLLALVWAGLRLDPLGLGRDGRYLVGGLLVAMVASAWASPVTRAGLEGLLLLPAWLTLPAAVALCWRRPEDRRRGLPAVAAVVAVVSLWALADWVLTPTPRPSRPLGHHNFLAWWLVTLLPPVALTLRGGRRSRWMGMAALGFGIAALLATRSLAGLGALLVSGLGLWLWLWLGKRDSKRRWPVLLALLALGLVVVWLGAPRAWDVLAGRDPSFEARRVYLRAGTEGALERPLTGWGPGATPWTLALFLDPEPGINPPSEVVGQLHALPLQIAYEVGLPGFLLALAVVLVFVLYRWRQVSGTEERATALGALGGLAAAAVASLGTAGFSVTALPVAWALAAGAALSVSPQAPRPHPRARTAALVVAALVLVALLPWLRARHLYEQAAEAAELEGAEQRLATAVELDPAFPLYRARWAWTTGSAEEARRAAADALGLAPLWLQAGVLGLESGEGWTPDALVRACRLDPFSPFAPWFLARSDPETPKAPRRVARALLLEPRLVAALWLADKPELRAMAAREIVRWPGVDPGLREALGSALEDVGTTRSENVANEEVAALVLTLEGRPDQPFALHAFRRLSWPARLAAVPVDAATARGVDLPSAAARPETTTAAFGTLRGCR